MQEKGPEKNFLRKLAGGAILGTSGVILTEIGMKVQSIVLANRQAYEPLCDKYGKNTVDFLISSSKDTGWSFMVLGLFGTMSTLNENSTKSGKYFDLLLRISVISLSLLPMAFEVNDLINPAMHQVCEQTGHSCGSVGDLAVFALPAIVVLPGLINNYLAVSRERGKE